MMYFLIYAGHGRLYINASQSSYTLLAVHVDRINHTCTKKSRNKAQVKNEI